MPRDYKKEYQNAKSRDTMKRIVTVVPNVLFEDFSAKCEMEGVSKNSVIRNYIETYVYGEKDKKNSPDSSV